MFNNIINERSQNIENLENNIRKMQKNADINLSKKDIESLFKFESQRQYWTPKLQALAELTPLNMVLTELEFSKKKLKITAMTKLEDNVKEFDVIEEFMNLIKENENFNNNFKDIKFVSSSREKTNKSPTLSFKVEAKLIK
jgi:Tfp pilus assembly protein PilN